MDPYVKIYFGGQHYRTSVCKNGGKNPSWNEIFTFNPAGDSNLRIEVWDSDLINDDLVAEGSFNLMKVYSMPSMHSNNEYIDLFYKGKNAGRILISFELKGMGGYWGPAQQGFANCNQQGFGNMNPMGGNMNPMGGNMGGNMGGMGWNNNG